MVSEKKTASATARQLQPAYEDEISLVDIYITVKRSNKLFFFIIVLSFFISLLITYFKYQPNTSKEVLSNSSAATTEYVLWIEIGVIHKVNAGNNWIDDPDNTFEKIKSIYIPKIIAEFMSIKGSELNQSSISVMHPKKSKLIVVKVIKTTDSIDYNKVLMSLASYILEDHNKWYGLINNKNISFRPTRIIEGPTKIIVKNKNKKKNIMLIPILGTILGVFLGLFAVFIRGFLKKVKEVEKSS